MEDSSLEDAFDAATQYVGAASTSGSLSNDQLLQFYGCEDRADGAVRGLSPPPLPPLSQLDMACVLILLAHAPLAIPTARRLYKQATVGPCDAPRPSFFDRKGRAKWQAWADLGQLPGSEAQQRYVDLLNRLIPGWAAGSSSSGSSSGGGKRGGAGGPVQSRMAEAAEDEQAAVRRSKGEALGWHKAVLMVLPCSCSLPAVRHARPPPSHCSLQGPDAAPPLLQAARAGDAAAVEALLQSGCDTSQRGSEGETALHWAADRGHKAVAAVLLKHGADVNATDNDGLTACHYAALAEQRGAAELLAAAPGVQLGLRSADGEAAADVAPPGWDFLQAGGQ